MALEKSWFSYFKIIEKATKQFSWLFCMYYDVIHVHNTIKGPFCCHSMLYTNTVTMQSNQKKRMLLMVCGRETGNSLLQPFRRNITSSEALHLYQVYL